MSDTTQTHDEAETCTACGEVNHGLTYSPHTTPDDDNVRLCGPCWDVQYDHAVNACGDNPQGE